MKKYILIFMIIALTACSKSEQKSANGKTQINFYSWAENYNTNLVDAFNKSQNDVEVIFKELPTGEYETKITTLLAGGAGDVDVYAQKRQTDMIPHYKNGFIAPLDELAKKYNYNFDAIDSYVDLLTVDKKLLGLPFRGAGYYIFYNKVLFDNAGVPYPDEYIANGEWTWDKYIDVAIKTSDAKNDQYGALMYVWSFFNTVKFAQEGNQFITNSGELDFDKDSFIKSVKIRKTLEEAKATLPLRDMRVQKRHYSDLFYSGKFAMLLLGEWFPGFMTKGKDKNLLQGYTWNDWGIARLPYDGKGEYTSIGLPTFAHIYSRSKKKDAAFQFLAWMSEENGGGKILAKDGLLPAATGPEVNKLLSSAIPDKNSLEYFTEKKKIHPAFPLNQYGAQIEQLLGDKIDLYLYDNYSDDDFYNVMKKGLETIVKTTK